MSWIYLILAIIFEIVGTTLMKMSNGFSYVLPGIGMIVSYVFCFGFLTMALKTLNMSVAYAIWAGLGTALIALIGFVFFKEEVNLIKVLSLLLIILGVVGLNLSGKVH